MNLTTSYLGLSLKNPLMPGASPLVDNLDQVKRLEDAGAAAVVMHSLFAEQIERDERALTTHVGRWENNFAEASSFLPLPADYALGPDEYLARVARLKEVCSVPVIASLNGTRTGSWVQYAHLIEQAGADALELNTWFFPTDIETSPQELEDRLIEVVRAVRSRVKLPLAVKLSPYYSSLGHLVTRLDAEGAEAVVLFNRFFQPDIDVESLELAPKLELSTSEDLRLRLRWLGVLHGRTEADLACSGGVNTFEDVIRAILAGADVVQIVAALLRRGPGRIAEMLEGLRDWMERHEYTSVSEMRGALSLARCPDPEAYERGNYLKTLQLWRE